MSSAAIRAGRSALHGATDPVGAALFEWTNLGVLVVDRGGAILRSNARLSRLVGADADLSPGSPCQALFAAEEQQALWLQLQRRLSAEGPGPPVLARLSRDGTDERVVEVTAGPLRCGDTREAAGLILLLEDVTSRERLQEQLSQGQKLQAVGQLAAGIAHDFNNLLTAVLNAAEMIDARAEADPQIRRDAVEIRDSAERGAALVRQLLAFGRQQALSPRAIVVNDAINDLARLLARLLGGRIAITLELSEAAGVARVDPTQLDQVLINLAVNARNAMEQGGTLTLRTGHIALYRPLARGPELIPPGQYVMIEVQDTGAGIDPQVLPRIFDPFFTTRRERGGTGLGLSTVHGIIRQSNGFLGVESEPGRGTRMRVYLPRSDDAADRPAQTALRTKALPAARALRLLLVDDENAVRTLAERALMRAGWTVLSADSAEAALAMMDEAVEPLDLLISDVAMPGLDGPALAAQLRQRWPRMPVLLISGYADERQHREMRAGQIELLVKPYRLHELVECAARLAASPRDA